MGAATLVPRSQAILPKIEDELHAPFSVAVAMGAQQWRAQLEQAQSQNKALFLHEHPHFALDPDLALYFALDDWNRGPVVPARNYTMILEDLMLLPGTLSIFTIRHPALIVPSAYRAMDEPESISQLGS
ncbi:hypothetical protein AC578_9590 [Pseudocercospora eumusae]|uniref:Uncharacterized protein n=1 Tax=Pseudocercospora eumusae TaxID=321146 RepID=A0A139GY08_9PEZI|nr:hypothetical protein AC578_9590 [Pseudocercospora eumusae]